MKVPSKPRYISNGMNGMSLMASAVYLSVAFGDVSVWALLPALGLLLVGYGSEIRKEEESKVITLGENYE